MNKKTYFQVVSAIFFIIAALHLLRIFNRWEASVGDFVVPLWLSWGALVFFGYLAFHGFTFARKVE
ncbi:MAG: hypothetical protein AAB830_01970 [Patescibacteria group bacterium]